MTHDDVELMDAQINRLADQPGITWAQYDALLATARLAVTGHTPDGRCPDCRRTHGGHDVDCPFNAHTPDQRAVADEEVERVSRELHGQGPASPNHIFWQSWDDTAPFVREKTRQLVREVLTAARRAAPSSGESTHE